VPACHASLNKRRLLGAAAAAAAAGRLMGTVRRRWATLLYRHRRRRVNRAIVRLAVARCLDPCTPPPPPPPDGMPRRIGRLAGVGRRTTRDAALLLPAGRHGSRGHRPSDGLPCRAVPPMNAVASRRRTAPVSRHRRH